MMDVFMLPAEGEKSAFNLDIDFNKNGLISVWTNNIQIKGAGQILEKDKPKNGFAFGGKIDEIKAVYNLNNQDTNKLG